MTAILENLQRQDGIVLTALVLITLLGTYAADAAVKAASGEQAAMQKTAMFDMATVAFMALMLLAGIIVSYFAVRVYGGTVGKGFYMFIWGFIFQLALPIEVAWHLMNLPKMVGAPWLGIPSYWWFGFFHAMIAVSIGLMGYGLYILVRDLEPV